jgi:hypothetical protein
MHIVALLDAIGKDALDSERLASDIGDAITALEVRMALSATPPSIFLRVPSPERAEEITAILAAAGLNATAVDLNDVVPVGRMVHMHRFAMGTDALRADDRGPTLAYGDIEAIVRVAAETAILRTTREKESTGVGGKATAALVEHTRTDQATEHVPFLFVRGGGVPWVMRAGEARYLTLGAALRPTTLENFRTTVALLREKAPRAGYDDRFVALPLVRQAEAHVRDHESAAPDLGDRDMEVRLHLLVRALTVGRDWREGPYR